MIGVGTLNITITLEWLDLQIRVSAVLTNAPYILNLDCDHYVNNCKAVREAMCFLMDPQVGRDVCYVQFPNRFDGIDRSDRYANRNTVFFDVSLKIARMDLSVVFVSFLISTCLYYESKKYKFQSCVKLYQKFIHHRQIFIKVN